MREIKLMACGCSAMAYDKKTGRDCCITHLCYDVMPEPDLSERTARCTYCKNESGSKVELPFFVYQPSKPLDRYYCGCMGWE